MGTVSLDSPKVTSLASLMRSQMGKICSCTIGAFTSARNSAPLKGIGECGLFWQDVGSAKQGPGQSSFVNK